MFFMFNDNHAYNSETTQKGDEGLVSAQTIPFAEYCAKVQAHVETYGIRVITEDVPDPLTGDLDGAEIHIDYALSPEQRLFLLVHLFGHTVQWNMSPRAFELGQNHEPPVDETLLPAIMEYEGQAASYALGMLHEIGIDGIDQWLSDYTAGDQAYLQHYYRTGEKKEFRNFWRDNTPLIEAQPVPAFKPTRKIFRRDGIVI